MWREYYGVDTPALGLAACSWTAHTDSMGILGRFFGKSGGRNPASKRTSAQIARDLEEKAAKELKNKVDDLVRASKSAEDALKKLHEKRYGLVPPAT